MYPFCFGGHDFLAMQDAALFWPARRALLVADLHLEKASWYALRGQMLPPYDSMATLERVNRLIDRTDARELWALGDSFHDTAGVERLAPDVAEGLRALSRRIDLHWIAGNHDGLSGAAFGGQVHEDALLDGVMLRHHAAPLEEAPEISGHFHPVWCVSGRGRNVRRRCFLHDRRKLIMPAFGTLAGGLDARDPIYQAILDKHAQALVPLSDRLLQFPVYPDAVRTSSIASCA